MMNSIIKRKFKVPMLCYNAFRQSFSVLTNRSNNFPLRTKELNSICTSFHYVNRFQMSTSSSSKIVNIGVDELVNKQKDPKVVIVDVREKKEIDETGILPGAIHIPVGEVGEALKLTEENFRAKYKAQKPGEDTPIVFSCRSGKRSLMASEAAVAAGYNQVMNFTGGWLGWEEHCKNTK